MSGSPAAFTLLPGYTDNKISSFGKLLAIVKDKGYTIYSPFSALQAIKEPDIWLILRHNGILGTPLISIYSNGGGFTIHEQERDVAKFWTAGGTRIAILGVENQTKPDADMPLRIIGYDGASYKEQSLQHDAAKRKSADIKPLPTYPAVTIVINYGRVPWNQPKSLLECIGEERIPECIRPYVNDYKIHVVDLATLNEDTLAKLRSDFQHVASVLWAEYNNKEYVPSGKDLVHADETLKALSALTGNDDFLRAYNSIPQEEKEGGVNMCRIVNEFVERGMAQGMAQGMERGIETGIAFAAKVIGDYMTTKSVKETSKLNAISEAKVNEILGKANVCNV